MLTLKGFGDGYGIGSSESFSIIQLAKLLGLKYKLTPPKKGNRMSAELKISKTKKLGWRCKYNLKDYINKNNSLGTDLSEKVESFNLNQEFISEIEKDLLEN